MAYIKNNWVDREGTTRYFETVDDDGALILTPDYTQVTEMGTPVNADNMNHIEEGIAAGSFTKYDSMATYAKNDLVTTIVDNELKVYKSLQDNNTSTLNDSSFWEEVEFSGGGGAGLQLFDTILKDHVLTYEETKGLALQGTYVYKEAIAGSRYGYPDFYAKCLEEYNEAKAGGVKQLELDGTTVSMFVHSNGHMYYDISIKSTIDSWFNTFGTAWFYGVDTENERIFLPRNNWFDQMAVNTSGVGSSVQAGLPTHTHTRGTMNITASWTGEDGDATGAIYSSGTVSDNVIQAGGSTDHSMRFDASRSWTGKTSAPDNSVYGKSTTVQPNAVKKLLYICVGNTISETSWVDVVTQVEGGVKDLEDKTSEGLEAIANASNALRQTQITNCILEVPQRIKYTLEDGVLTLKAGSVVIVPYGVQDLSANYPIGSIFLNESFKVYDSQYVNGKFFVWAELQVDIPHPITYVTGTRIVCLNMETAAHNGKIIAQVASGETTDTTVGYFYNTAENATYESGVLRTTCFPICIGEYIKDTGFSTISEVFNGMGYIGSVAWVDKGVKGLIPNGRNADGTLNNIEYITKTIEITTRMLTNKTNYYFIGTEFSNIVDKQYYISDVDRIAPAGTLVHNVTDNYIYDASGNIISAFYLGKGISGAEKLESVDFQKAFRAVDFNDLRPLSLPSARSVELTVGATNTSYKAPGDGWVYFHVVSTALNQYANLINNTLGFRICSHPPVAGYNGDMLLPVNKGDTFSLSYTTKGDSSLRFYYANGGK